ncbi:hypothetical protein [Serratia nevei]|uniref:hypothetical protein n=1 Tax=Serratia nevei TaxID=2703794 RepID=UPI002AA0CD7F|nr:hypothetical protein [Serratia nevei]
MNIRLNQISLIAAIAKEIDRQHPGIEVEARWFNTITQAANSICAEFAKPVVKASEGMGLTAWLESDDTGASSLYMASVLTGQFIAENHYPRDPADFGRCLRLVEAVPELECKIHDMSQHGKKWAVVAANWNEWAEVYRLDEGERLYRLMELSYEAGER